MIFEQLIDIFLSDFTTRLARYIDLKKILCIISRNFCKNYLPLLWRLSNDLFIYSLKPSSCSHFFHQLHMTLFMFLWFHMVTYGWSVRTYYVVIQIRLVQWRSRGCRHPAIFYRAGEAGRGYRKIVIFGQRQ